MVKLAPTSWLAVAGYGVHLSVFQSPKLASSATRVHSGWGVKEILKFSEPSMTTSGRACVSEDRGEGTLPRSMASVTCRVRRRVAGLELAVNAQHGRAPGAPGFKLQLVCVYPCEVEEEEFPQHDEQGCEAWRKCYSLVEIAPMLIRASFKLMGLLGRNSFAKATSGANT